MKYYQDNKDNFDKLYYQYLWVNNRAAIMLYTQLYVYQTQQFSPLYSLLCDKLFTKLFDKMYNI